MYHACAYSPENIANVSDKVTIRNTNAKAQVRTVSALPFIFVRETLTCFLLEFVIYFLTLYITADSEH